MTANLLTLNSSKTEFLLVGLPQQLAKINTSLLITTHSARNLGFIFDEHLTFSDHISALSKSCYYRIRELRCLRPYLDFTRNLSGDEIANVNFLYDDIVHVLQNTMDSCINSATD